MDMNLIKYKAFILAAEHKSITKAGEILDYSQSGISRMIHDLEEEWQVTLLSRNRKGVFLTADGKRLLPFAMQVCSDYEKLQAELADLKGMESGVIRIGTFSSVATHWLPKIIREFQKDYPGIDYELLLGDYQEIEDWVETGRVDCGFTILPTNQGFEITEMASDEMVAVIPKDHPCADESCFPMEEIQNAPFMLLEKGGKGEVADICGINHLKPDVKFTTWDDYAIMSMVENGLGISILPKLITSRAPYQVALLPLEKPYYRKIVFITRKKDSVSVAVRKFMQYLDYRNQ